MDLIIDRRMLEFSYQAYSILMFNNSVWKPRLKLDDSPSDPRLQELKQFNRLLLVLWKGHAVPPVASIAPEDESPLGSSNAYPFWLSLSTTDASLRAT